MDPLIDDGPADLLIAYALAAGGFDVLANGDHLAGWNVSAATLRDAAFRNLDGWSATAPWSTDAAERRRVISSDTGDGWDASRILLPDAIAYLEGELGAPGDRVLVGLPARHLLVAGSLHADDPEFGPLFADFVLEYSGDSDEAIDRRVFELRGGRLVLFDPPAPPEAAGLGQPAERLFEPSLDATRLPRTDKRPVAGGRPGARQVVRGGLRNLRWTGLPRISTSQVVVSLPARTSYSTSHQPSSPSPLGSRPPAP